jgi:hypothetical protein
VRAKPCFPHFSKKKQLEEGGISFFGIHLLRRNSVPLFVQDSPFSVTRRFVKKSGKFCQNIAQNGALVNKNFCPNKFLVKLGNFTTKSSPNLDRAY